MLLLVKKVFFVLLLLAAGSVSAQEKYALIIGNQNYSFGPLKNPVNDARTIAETLRLPQVGFKVTELHNSSRKQMVRALRKFSQSITPGSVALVYFAGHGAQFQGRNFLFPTDFEAEFEDELEVEAISTKLVLDKLRNNRNGLNILILDACRDNQLQRRSRSISRGLQREKSAPPNTFVIYAAAPGAVASDNPEEENGLFTQHLIRHIKRPSTDIESMMRGVRRDVLAASDNRQNPHSDSSLTSRFCFSGCEVAVVKPVPNVKPAPTLKKRAVKEVNVAFFLEWATPNQIAKVEKAYEKAMGVPVNWVNFDAGTQMTEAMLAGDIDISYSQGVAPFINAINSGAPIKMAGIAAQYPANDCVVRYGSGITSANAYELEGRRVSVPLATMADYSFRMMMRHLKVDMSKINIIDQVPADGAVSLADGNVTMACGFGGNSMAKMYEVGKKLMSAREKEAAGIISFDVVSVTEKFAQENPDLVKAFLKVTDEANMAFAKDQSQLDIIAKDAGMTPEAAKLLMNELTFPTNKEQLTKYLNKGGLASEALKVIGQAFASKERPALADYSVTIDTSFLE